jgi:hypothetical protein
MRAKREIAGLAARLISFAAFAALVVVGALFIAFVCFAFVLKREVEPGSALVAPKGRQSRCVTSLTVLQSETSSLAVAFVFDSRSPY